MNVVKLRKTTILSVADMSRNSVLRSLVATLSLSFAFAHSASAYTEVHPDWASIVAGGSVSIPNDTFYVIEESDMQYVNQLGEGKLTCPESSGVIVTNTTTWFRGNIFNWGSYGTIIKKGTSTLRQTTQMYYLRGSLIIEEGVFEQANHYLVDGGLYGGKCLVVVKDGATLTIDYASSHGTMKVIAEGEGYMGQGAIVFNKHGYLSDIVLSNDVKVVVNAPASAVDDQEFGQCIYSGAGRYATKSPAEIQMNGHKMSLSGTSSSIAFFSCKVLGGGSIEVAALDSGVRKIRIAGTTDLSDLDSFTVEGDVSIDFWNWTRCAQNVPLTAHGNLTFTYTDSPWTSDNPRLSKESCIWAGPISVADGKTLSIIPGGADKMINILGPISGNCSLAVGSSSVAEAGAVRLMGANTYTGDTTVYSTSSCRVYLGQPTSIPDYSRLVASPGVVVAEPTYAQGGATTWSSEQILALASTTGVSSAYIDTTSLTNAADIAITGLELAQYFPALNVTWCGSAGAGYSLSGPYPVDKPINLEIMEGTVRLTGSEQINLGSVLVSGTSATKSGTLILDGAADVVYSNETIVVGTLDSSLSSPIPRLIITNSTLRSTRDTDHTDVETGALFIGKHSGGVLFVEEGAVVSNKLVVGGGKSFYEGDGVGAIYQRGGVVTPRCGGAGHLSSYIGNAGHGSYHISGGTYHPTGAFQLGAYKTGVFLQTGGEVISDKGSFCPSSSNGGRATYTILNGTTRVSGSKTWTVVQGNGSGSYTQNVCGPNSVMSAMDAQYAGLLYNCNQSTCDFVQYNMTDGGVFELGGLYMYKDTYNNSHPLRVTFNGGVIKPKGTYQSFFAASGSKYKPKVVVYEKGAVICVPSGGSYASVNTIGAPLEGATGGGVWALALPEGGLSGYHAIPRVDIVGDGYGAAAVALVDSDTFTVTNILITSHGWDYTAENTKAYLRYGRTSGYSDKYTFPASSITIAENTPGGLTKTGPNGLNLYNTNTWARWTKVLEGTLRMYCDRSIPDDTVLTVASGATLDMNSMALPTFVGITPDSAGTVKNGTVVLSNTWNVAIGELPAPTGAISANVSICAGYTINVTDAELEIAPHELFRIAAGKSVTGMPTLAGADPNRWYLKKVAGSSGTSLQLRPWRGAVIFVK